MFEGGFLEYLQNKHIFCARGMFSWCQVIFFVVLTKFFFNPSNLDEIKKSHKTLLTTLFSIFFFLTLSIDIPILFWF